MIDKELEFYKKRKEFCKINYLDWKDDKFNMLDNLFIVGIKSLNDKSNDLISFNTLNYITIYFNRISQKYFCMYDDIEGINNNIDYITAEFLNILDAIFFKQFNSDLFDEIQQAIIYIKYDIYLFIENTLNNDNNSLLVAIIQSMCTILGINKTYNVFQTFIKENI